MNPEYISFTANLHEALAQMTDGQKSIVQEGIAFYVSEYKRCQSEADAKSCAYNFHAFIQDAVDSKIKEAKKEKVKPSCKPGCAFCCYSYVVITDDEAKLIAEFLKEDKIEINLPRLVWQSQITEEEWSKIKYTDRKCVFLDENNRCKIYKHRPASCRKLIVVTDPKLCDMENNYGAKVGKLMVVDAELATSAMFNCAETDSLPKLLINHL